MIWIHDDLLGDECPVEMQRVTRADLREVTVEGVPSLVCKACGGVGHRE